MSAYQVKLKGRGQIAEGTMAFHFEKPAGFGFVPGQAIDIILDNAPAADAQGARHTFSLVSAPFESELVVATRMRESSVFKRTLRALPEGSIVKVEGPFGELALDGGRPAVLIAGGIGITPFMSMLRQATKDGRPQRLSLIYSNRRPEDAAFLSELQAIERQNGNFRLLATMTEMGKSDREWNGATGFVDADLVKRFVGELAAPIYYVVGPPAMVEAIQRVLTQARVLEENIRTEEFYGY